MSYPQSGLIENKLLKKELEKHEFTQSKPVPWIWTHKWRPIQFTLVVNNFGAKYVGKEHAEHLISTLQEYYTITHDCEGKLYANITLDKYHQNHQVHLSMAG